jgi:hypothetical protein
MWYMAMQNYGFGGGWGASLGAKAIRRICTPRVGFLSCAEGFAGPSVIRPRKAFIPLLYGFASELRQIACCIMLQRT